MFRKIIMVASGTFLSRLFGFLREILMAAALGTGPIADAFNAAFRFPNSFRRLFAEGAFHTAFIPLFAQKIEKEGVKAAQEFSQQVLSLLFSLLLIFTIIMELAMPLLVRYIIAPGFTEGQQFQLTVNLALIMFPYLAAMSLAAFMSGILNSLRHYFAPALAPIFLNIILIAILAYNYFYDLSHIDLGFALAWGVFAAGLVQLLLLTIAVAKAKIKLKIAWPHFNDNIKKLFTLALPAAITGGITQINLLINTNIASKQAGAISSLAYADRLYQLPLGVIGIAIASVLLPELTRALQLKTIESKNLQNQSIAFAMLLSLPASMGFYLLSYPMVELVYEHGHFAAQATLLVSELLTIYGFGLPAFVLIKTFIPLFAARHDTKMPMFFAAISLFINLSLALTLFPKWGAKGLAVAEISAAWANVFLLFMALKRYNYWHKDKALSKSLVKIFISVLFMGAMIKLLLMFFPSPISSLSAKILYLFSLIGAGALAYFSAIFALKALSFAFLSKIGRSKMADK